jgi:hypothetical protein
MHSYTLLIIIALHFFVLHALSRYHFHYELLLAYQESSLDLSYALLHERQPLFNAHLGFPEVVEHAADEVCAISMCTVVQLLQGAHVVKVVKLGGLIHCAYYQIALERRFPQIIGKLAPVSLSYFA